MPGNKSHRRKTAKARSKTKTLAEGENPQNAQETTSDAVTSDSSSASNRRKSDTLSDTASLSPEKNDSEKLGNESKSRSTNLGEWEISMFTPEDTQSTPKNDFITFFPIEETLEYTENAKVHDDEVGIEKYQKPLISFLINFISSLDVESQKSLDPMLECLSDQSSEYPQQPFYTRIEGRAYCLLQLVFREEFLEFRKKNGVNNEKLTEMIQVTLLDSMQKWIEHNGPLLKRSPFLCEMHRLFGKVKCEELIYTETEIQTSGQIFPGINIRDKARFIRNVHNWVMFPMWANDTYNQISDQFIFRSSVDPIPQDWFQFPTWRDKQLERIGKIKEDDKGDILYQKLHDRCEAGMGSGEAGIDLMLEWADKHLPENSSGNLKISFINDMIQENMGRQPCTESKVIQRRLELKNLIKPFSRQYQEWLTEKELHNDQVQKLNQKRHTVHVTEYMSFMLKFLNMLTWEERQPYRAITRSLCTGEIEHPCQGTAHKLPLVFNELIMKRGDGAEFALFMSEEGVSQNDMFKLMKKHLAHNDRQYEKIYGKAPLHYKEKARELKYSTLETVEETAETTLVSPVLDPSRDVTQPQQLPSGDTNDALISKRAAKRKRYLARKAANMNAAVEDQATDSENYQDSVRDGMDISLDMTLDLTGIQQALPQSLSDTGIEHDKGHKEKLNIELNVSKTLDENASNRETVDDPDYLIPLPKDEIHDMTISEDIEKAENGVISEVLNSRSEEEGVDFAETSLAPAEESSMFIEKDLIIDNTLQDRGASHISTESDDLYVLEETRSDFDQTTLDNKENNETSTYDFTNDHDTSNLIGDPPPYQRLFDEWLSLNLREICSTAWKFFGWSKINFSNLHLSEADDTKQIKNYRNHLIKIVKDDPVLINGIIQCIFRDSEPPFDNVSLSKGLDEFGMDAFAVRNRNAHKLSINDALFTLRFLRDNNPTSWKFYDGLVRLILGLPRLPQEPILSPGQISSPLKKLLRAVRRSNETYLEILNAPQSFSHAADIIIKSASVSNFNDQLFQLLGQFQEKTAYTMNKEIDIDKEGCVTRDVERGLYPALVTEEYYRSKVKAIFDQSSNQLVTIKSNHAAELDAQRLQMIKDKETEFKDRVKEAVRKQLPKAVEEALKEKLPNAVEETLKERMPKAVAADVQKCKDDLQKKWNKERQQYKEQLRTKEELWAKEKQKFIDDLKKKEESWAKEKQEQVDHLKKKEEFWEKEKLKKEQDWEARVERLNRDNYSMTMNYIQQHAANTNAWVNYVGTDFSQRLDIAPRQPPSEDENINPSDPE